MGMFVWSALWFSGLACTKESWYTSRGVLHYPAANRDTRKTMRVKKQVFLAFFLSLCLSSPLVWGQSGEGSDAEKRKKAAEFFEEGEKRYNLQEYDKALELYKEAYLLAPEPELLFNIGQCYRQLEKYEEALKSYQTFLRLLAPDDPRRPAIDKLIGEVKDLLEEKKSTAETSPTGTTKNGAAPAEAGAPGENATNLAPPALTPVDDKKTGASPAMFLYVGAGGALALGVTTGVLAISAGSRLKRLQAQDGASEAEIEGLFRRAKTFGLVADLATGAALASGVAGFLLQRSAKKATEKVAGVALGVSPSGVMLTGRF